jgi:hypothetical protein
MRIDDATRLTTDEAGTATQVTPNKWHNCILTFISRWDVDYSNIRIFQDLVLVKNYELNKKTVNLNGVSIGSEFDAQTHYFKGHMFYTKVFNSGTDILNGPDYANTTCTPKKCISCLQPQDASLLTSCSLCPHGNDTVLPELNVCLQCQKDEKLIKGSCRRAFIEYNFKKDT